MDNQENVPSAYRRYAIRRRIWRWVQLVVVLGALCGAAYWLFLRPVTVKRHIVGRGEIVAEVMGTGTLEARRQAVISAEISGLIVAVNVDEGDRVLAGQELLRLDDEDLRRQVEASESSLAEAEAGVARREADKQRAQAVLDQAGIDYRRVMGLIERSAASSLERDKSTESLRVAQAELGSAEAALIEAEKKGVGRGEDASVSACSV